MGILDYPMGITSVMGILDHLMGILDHRIMGILDHLMGIVVNHRPGPCYAPAATEPGPCYAPATKKQDRATPREPTNRTVLRAGKSSSDFLFLGMRAFRQV